MILGRLDASLEFFSLFGAVSAKRRGRRVCTSCRSKKRKKHVKGVAVARAGQNKGNPYCARLLGDMIHLFALTQTTTAICMYIHTYVHTLGFISS